jgi:predicted negative regulator of RcsB-dependent stress response
MTDSIKLIAESSVYAQVAAAHADVEIWDDAGYVDDAGRAYFSVVARGDHAVRKLACLRVAGTQIEQRSYDANGDDLWEVVT